MELGELRVVPSTSIHVSFEHAGVEQALQRLERAFRRAHPDLWSAWLPSEPLPAFVHACDFEASCASATATPDACAALVRGFRALRDFLGAQDAPLEFIRRAGAEESAERIGALDASDPSIACALARLAYGELLEASAAREATSICNATSMPVFAISGPALARLHHDAYLAALWTSAHAEYLASAAALVAESNGEARASDAPPPNVYSTTSLSSAPDLSVLFHHRFGEYKTVLSKAASSMLEVLVRCSNAGSRGWDRTLAAALAASEGANKFVSHVLIACLSGMTPCIHPSRRPSWPYRFAIRKACQPLTATTADLRTVVQKSPTHVKECVRAYMCLMLSGDFASKQAFATFRHAATGLHSPPFELPHPSLKSIMQDVVACGTKLLEGSKADEGAAVAISALFEAATASNAVRQDKAAPVKSVRSNEMPTISYSQTWMVHRAPSARPCTHTRFAEVATFVLKSSFTSHFAPLWMHAHDRATRICRLNHVYHSALYRDSPFHGLCALLPEKEALCMQRAALSRPDASLLTMQELYDLLRDIVLPRAGKAAEAKISESHRACHEAVHWFFALEAAQAARMLHFCKCASLREQLLSFDLGPRTRTLQLRALAKRFGVPFESTEDLEGLPSRLPKHATCVFACHECKRVANATWSPSCRESTFDRM